MTLQEYLDYGPLGLHNGWKESEWLEFRSLDIAGGKLAVVDPTLFEGPIIDVPPGTYRVQVVVMDRRDDRRIARLRVLMGAEASAGDEIDSVGVDFAQVGVGDWEAVTRAAAALDRPGEEAIIATMDTLDLYGVIVWSPNGEADMPFVSSGYGDGSYPIYEIRRDGTRVGIEVVFIDHDGRPPM